MLEDLYGEQTGQVAVQLARHFEMAGLTAKAVKYLYQAGKRAVRLSAYQEAIAHFTQALELLKTLSDTPERARQELDLQIALGPALMATKGYTAPEVEQAYVRGRELCQQIGETAQLFPALWGLWTFYLVRAELQTARELAEELLSLAQSRPDAGRLLVAYRALGFTLLNMGELTPARARLEQSIALYDPLQHGSLAFLYGSDAGVSPLSYLTLTMWLLGYPDQALKRSGEALALAQQVSHPLSLAMALLFRAMIHQYRREVNATQEQAKATITVSADQGIPQFLAQGISLQGWGLARQKRGAEGIAKIRQGLVAYRDIGSEALIPYHMSLLADAYGEVGQAAEGLLVIAEALALVDRRGTCLWEAELHRLKGELLLKDEGGRQKDEKAEECFLKAIEIARRQEAKSLELRAVMSLSRLWQGQGKREEARRMLAEIYDWFTEGFDTPDLQEARALLEALA